MSEQNRIESTRSSTQSAVEKLAEDESKHLIRWIDNSHLVDVSTAVPPRSTRTWPTASTAGTAPTADVTGNRPGPAAGPARRTE